MMRKRCNTCGVECWHNFMKKKKDEEQRVRCTFCGDPPQGNSIGDKNAQQKLVRDRQVARARLLHIVVV